ncbi:N-acetylglucosamine kinase [Cyanobium sp. FGCU-52]|nr:N-acetylglucosamine kinase [Cyanobium sp. FGCU52]
MPEGLIAGFDAGQTHTTCRLATAAGGLVLAEGEGPGVCHLAAPGGEERFQDALQGALAAARGRLTECPASLPLVAAAVGASGIEQGSAVQERGQSLAARCLGLASGRTAVTGDERTALRGAFPDGPGIVVISGTGTIAVGRDGRGREHRCGGWGWLLDGAGAAMDIGRDGLALSLRMADGRRPDTPLRAALWDALGLDPADPGAPQRIKAQVVSPQFGPAGFARLAPVVHREAQAGDPEAEAILMRSALALAEMVAGVAAALHLDAPAVCGMGGALENLEGLRIRFARNLAGLVPQARLVVARGDACAGALALAVELAEAASAG